MFPGFYISIDLSVLAVGICIYNEFEEGEGRNVPILTHANCPAVCS